MWSKVTHHTLNAWLYYLVTPFLGHSYISARCSQALSPDFSITHCIRSTTCVQRWLVGSHQQAVGSVILREFVSHCAVVTATQSSRGRQEGRQMVLLSISQTDPERPVGLCCCCNWLTHFPPSCSPCAVLIVGLCKRRLTLDTQNEAGWSRSVFFYRMWLQTISNDLISDQ